MRFGVEENFWKSQFWKSEKSRKSENFGIFDDFSMIFYISKISKIFRVRIFFTAKKIVFRFFMIPTLSVGYKKCVTGEKEIDAPLNNRPLHFRGLKSQINKRPQKFGFWKSEINKRPP